ncbi:MAG: hypothetical protein ABDH21_00815 [bacterium]
MENLYRLLDKLEANMRKNKIFGMSIIKHKENLTIINKIRQILMESYTPSEELIKLRKELEIKERELNNLKNNLIENEEIVKMAYVRAQEIEKQAKEEAQELITGAEKYAFKILDHFEEELKRLITTVQNSKKNLESEINLETNKVGVKKVENNKEIKKVNIRVT